MIPRFQNFSVFKAKPSDNEKLPTHALSMKLGEEFVNIGGAWTRDASTGKYLSCKLADAWVSSEDNTKSREGFVIVRVSDLDRLEKLVSKQAEDNIPMTDDDGRELNPEDIPF